MFKLEKLLRGNKYKDQNRQLSDDIRAEMGRRKSQANKILADLIVHGERYTYQIEKHAFNYTGRISDLRRRGYLIECEYESPGNYLYKYYGFKPNTKAAKEQVTA